MAPQSVARKSYTFYSHPLITNNGELFILTTFQDFLDLFLLLPLSTSRESYYTLTVLNLQCMTYLDSLHAIQFTQAMNLGTLRILIP